MTIIGKQIRDVRILSVIGEGGMGVVYLAEHIRLGRKLAVKCLSPELASNPEVQRRFREEGISQALLCHPNIVQVSDFFEEDGNYYLVMEYVKGHSLDKIIDTEGISEKICVPFLKDILSGLNFAHSQGVIHRDIKPSNIIIDQMDRARIMDFGIAIRAGEKRLTKTGMDVGTAWYMSPEQVLKPKDIDYRSDVYSVGVVLYEMLSGEVPFDGETDYEVKSKHVNETPAHICLVNSNVSLELAGIVMKALEKDPDDRFDGCGEFLDYILEYEKERDSSEVFHSENAGQSEHASQAKTGFAGKFDKKVLELEKSAPESENEKSEETARQMFTDPVTGMEFVLVSEGRFQMGDVFGDGNSDEKPIRQMEVSAFYMGKTPVTQGQWKRVMGNNPSRFKEGDNYPVEMVSWEDAQEFIQKLTFMNDRKYFFRLPAEAEWEFAAKSGGKEEKFAGANSVETVAWYDENSGNATHPVGEKEPNGLGLHDMSGNVWEWCQDCFIPYSSEQPFDEADAPPDAPRTLRGGSWDSHAAKCRTMSRSGNWPKYRDNNWGFRLVVDMKAPEELQGNLRISSRPKGASIWLDDINTMLKTDAVIDIRDGKYKVTLRLNGYEDDEREIEVTQFAISEINARFEEKRPKAAAKAVSNKRMDSGHGKSPGSKIGIAAIVLVCVAVLYGGFTMLFQGRTTEKPTVTSVDFSEGDESAILNENQDIPETRAEMEEEIVSKEPSHSVSSSPLPKTNLGCIWGNCTNGYGTYVLPDGSRYTGTFKENKFHGEGTFTHSDGKKYVGKFYEGKRRGTGTLTYTDGSTYDGDFLEGEPHGQGLLTIPKVGKYKGRFKKGSPYGRGTLFTFDGRTFKGQYNEVMSQYKAPKNQATVRPKPQPKIVVAEKPAVPETVQKKKEPDDPNKPIETSEYISYPGGIVRDKRSDLEWRVGPDKNTTFREAESWVKDLHSSAGGDWRLPSLEELRTLYKRGSGRINITPFLKTSGWKMWATPGESEASAEGGRYFNFSYGASGWGDSRYDADARAFAVREAKTPQ